MISCISILLQVELLNSSGVAMSVPAAELQDLNDFAVAAIAMPVFHESGAEVGSGSGSSGAVGYQTLVENVVPNDPLARPRRIKHVLGGLEDC